MIEISIIICCYNSQIRIEPTLLHLANQQVKGLSCEVILVDNNCSDETVAIAKSKWQEYGNPFPLVIIEERKPGLSNARMAGVSASEGEIVIFCDDDNWFNSEYIISTFNIFKNNPRVGAVGGYGIAKSEIDFPDWFEKYKHGYAVGIPNLQSGILPNTLYLTGAGLGVKKAAFISIFQDFDSLLQDRSGKLLTSGGDTEICLRLLLKGYKLYYSDKLNFIHFIPKERLSIEYRDTLFSSFSLGADIINCYQLILRLKDLNCLYKCYELIKAIIRMLLLKLNLFGYKWKYEMNNTVIYVLTGIIFRPVIPLAFNIKSKLTSKIW